MKHRLLIFSLLFLISYPIGWFVSDLMSDGQDAAGKGIGEALGVLFGFAIRVIASLCIGIYAIQNRKKLGSLFILLLLLPWILQIIYGLVFTDLFYFLRDDNSEIKVEKISSHYLN